VGRKKLTEPKKICALKKKVKLEKNILRRKKNLHHNKIDAVKKSQKIKIFKIDQI